MVRRWGAVVKDIRDDRGPVGVIVKCWRATVVVVEMTKSKFELGGSSSLLPITTSSIAAAAAAAA